MVAVAQLEQELELPKELDEPWEFLQHRFGCASKSGNVTSNVINNFDKNGQYVYRVNEGFPDVVPSEEAFMRIMREVEAHVRHFLSSPASLSIMGRLLPINPCRLRPFRYITMWYWP